jgi:hypothetical protein
MNKISDCMLKLACRLQRKIENTFALFCRESLRQNKY